MEELQEKNIDNSRMDCSTPGSEGHQKVKKKPKFVMKSQISKTSNLKCLKANEPIGLDKSVCQSDEGINSFMDVDELNGVAIDFLDNRRTETNRECNMIQSVEIETNPKEDHESFKIFDSSLHNFLLKVSNLTVVKNYDTASPVTKTEIEECKVLYIELLEKVSEAFRKLFDVTKKFINGNNDEIYKSINQIEIKLKSIIQSREQLSGDESNHFNDSRILEEIQDTPTFSISDDELSRIQRLEEENANDDTNRSLSGNSFCENQTDIMSKAISKRSLSLNSNSSNSSMFNMSNNQPEVTNRTKKRFQYKRPSSISLIEPNERPTGSIPSSTLDRVKHASSKLQPLPSGSASISRPMPASSVPFQPKEFSKDILNTHKTDTMSRNNSFESDIDNNIDVSFVDDSIPAYSVKDTSNSVLIDDDGWQVYDPSLFGDDNTVDSSEHSVVQSERDLPLDQNEDEPVTTYEGMGEFSTETQNDGITGEFDGLNYPHSDLMMTKLKEKFGLRSFRPNQLQVINAAMLNHDCFVLMPTGGGKSLCYQLPAILTPGLTIVVSPLRSLILDQVNKLNSLDIHAAYFSGEQSAAEANEVYYQLSLAEPTLRLLYVTPEKLSSSEKFRNTLDMLYSRNLIARFVVDEAHCVSTWGHDFRKDYKRLGELRARYPRVRVMALTATATPRVRTDILHQLKVTKCKWFLCSFNRPNLSFEVLPKTPKTVNKDIIDVIRQRFSGQSGIVYCLFRKECEALAQALCAARVPAAAYHAGLAPRAREDVQAGWLADRYAVICATIAFGMGIDKADVRYVIHHSLPKSVEGYYQEAGRAGRDGQPAACLLYYNYCDVSRIRKMQKNEKYTTKEAKQVHQDNLMLMAEMCDNVWECRRVQVLAYLGERFSRQRCARGRAPCDACRATAPAARACHDVTGDCVTIARAVRGLQRSYTLLQLADVMRGSNQKRIAQLQGSPLHGLCKTWPRGDAQRLLRQLLFKKVLEERLVINNDISNAYIVAGPEIDRLLSGEMKIEFAKQPQAAQAAAPARPARSAPAADVLVKQLEDRCYADLIEACRQMAQERGASLQALFPQVTLRAMALKLPATPEAMQRLPHVTSANYTKYGQRLLSLTSSYAKEKIGILKDKETEVEKQAPKASTSTATWNSQKKAKPRRTRSGVRRGGVQKRTKWEGSSIAKTKALLKSTRIRKLTREMATTPSKAAGGSRLGAMPLPRANAAMMRPGVAHSTLKFL